MSKRRVGTEQFIKPWFASKGWIIDDCGGFQGRFDHDLFGVFDLVAFQPDEPWTLFIQATDYSNYSARVRKVMAWEHLDEFINDSRIVIVAATKKNTAGIREFKAAQILSLAGNRRTAVFEP